MKKIIIIAVVILSSAVTAFCITRNNDTKATNTIKIEKADFAVKSMSTEKSDLGSAD